jgi:O-acetylhomoserine/O-acetylserine sulfhydrylase-like pyridoxal-dependent enzyme
MLEDEKSPELESYLRRGQADTEALADLRNRMRQMKFDTIAVTGLYGLSEALDNQGSIIEPAYLSSAQSYENSAHLEAALADWMPSWTYARYGNPTVGYLEETLALLEGYGFAGETSALAVGSGMAAVSLATEPFLLPPDGPEGEAPNFVSSAKCYGGTFVLFSERYAARGYQSRWIHEPLDLDEWAAAIDENTRFVYAEMPSNPSLAVCDLEALANLAHAHELPLIVDATVATPALLRPLRHGADIVVHSVSKSMSSSGFAIAGALIARHDLLSRVGHPELRNDFVRYVKTNLFREFGAALSPLSALLILNEIRTLRTRMDHLSRNAMQVARFLSQQPQVARVSYPGLSGTPEHAVAARYMFLVDSENEGGRPVSRYGHLLSFDLADGPEAARLVYDNMRLIWRAADLGRIKTLATIPAISTHQRQGEAARDLADVPPNMIRLSVGAEHPEDIIADLAQAIRS